MENRLSTLLVHRTCSCRDIPCALSSRPRKVWLDVEDKADTECTDSHRVKRDVRLRAFFGLSSLTTLMIWICCAKNSCVPGLSSQQPIPCTGRIANATVPVNHLIQRRGDEENTPHSQDAHNHFGTIPRRSVHRPLGRLACPYRPQIALTHHRLARSAGSRFER